MKIQKEVFVLGAKRLDFENNGDKVQGVSVHYYSDSVNEQDVKGCIPAKAWLPISEFAQFEGHSYPAIANVEFDIDMAKGKLVPRKFKFAK